ncbi:MAG: integrase arm-type DNA-binding domain-containing protein [Alphaproteobacteria bacterium]
MTRTTSKLSAITVSRIKQKGLYSDGGGLYLRVKDSGGKFWVLRYMLDGKAREMGLGALHALTLAEARDKAADCRKQLASKIDPIATRDDAQTQKKVDNAKAKTFKECAQAYIEAHEKSWRNAKHVQQWGNTLATYAYPIMGDLPVQNIDLALITAVLEQKKKAFGKKETLWTARPETASRLRGRLEVILDWAATREYRKGENPARWRGHLENLLPKRARVQRIKHQPALPYEKIGDFMSTLKGQEGTAAKAMMFTILTACRTSEAIGATWGEIDLAKGVWVIPADRIKAGREHRVPLSKAVVELLESLGEIRNKGFVFTGYKPSKPLSNMAMLALLRRMKRRDITVHGFRSSFRDWTAEQTNFPREVAEAALAHAVGDKVEAAYRRSDLFDKRRLMMDEWARYCATPSVKDKGDNVTPIRKK